MHAVLISQNCRVTLSLTRPTELRTVASKHQIEVHGVLWAIDEIHKAETAKVSELLDALALFESDPTIFRLPNRDLKAFIRRYTPLVTKK